MNVVKATQSKTSLNVTILTVLAHNATKSKKMVMATDPQKMDLNVSLALAT